ncbi:hypothetical protein [Roseateles sp. MS654]|uniref:hypothetical protein n=1 Tax=Roseateles sp. MS654 TaxID=3412685 RepID=UPI003C2BE6A0
MRHRFAPPAGDPGHPFSSVMQRILRQTEVLLQRRIPFSPSGWPLEEPPALEGLEVRESTWDEWTEALAHQSRGSAR